MQTDHKSSLFLMELIFTILFFALASAVCMQLFARAHTLQTDTEDLNQSILLAQSAAESFESTGGDLNAFAEIFPEGALDASGTCFTVFYQADGSPLPASGTGSDSPDTGSDRGGETTAKDTGGDRPAEAAYQLVLSLEVSEAGTASAGEAAGPVSGDFFRKAQVSIRRFSGPEDEGEIIYTMPAAVQIPRSVDSQRSSS